MDSSTNGGVRQSCAWSAGPGLDAAALNLVLDSPSSAASPPAYAAQATPSPSKDDALFFSNADSISVEPHDGEAAPRSVFECDSPPLESAPQSLGLNAGASAFANSISTFWRRGGSQPPSPTDAVPTLPKTGPSPSYHSTNVAGGDKLTRTEKAEVDKLVGRLDNVLRARWGQVKNALGSNPLAAQGSMSPARTTPRHRRTGAINAGSA